MRTGNTSPKCAMPIGIKTKIRGFPRAKQRSTHRQAGFSGKPTNGSQPPPAMCIIYIGACFPLWKASAVFPDPDPMFRSWIKQRPSSRPHRRRALDAAPSGPQDRDRPRAQRPGPCQPRLLSAATPSQRTMRTSKSSVSLPPCHPYRLPSLAPVL